MQAWTPILGAVGFIHCNLLAVSHVFGTDGEVMLNDVRGLRDVEHW